MPCPVPAEALLQNYLSKGDYTDCFSNECDRLVSLEQFVTAFYTTRLFKLERLILQWVVSRPSSDQDARQLAEGKTNHFAAWTVEDRLVDQLLMCDINSKTRSWFMVRQNQLTGSTRLYFGSAVISQVDEKTQQPGMSSGFNALLGFHKLYSKLLLQSARSKIIKIGKVQIDP